MSKVKRVCETSEFWGSKKTHCYYELEEIEPDDLIEQLKDAIYEGLDEIPNKFTFVHIECLDEECWDAEEIKFEIDPRDYLSKEEIKELEKLIKNNINN